MSLRAFIRLCFAAPGRMVRAFFLIRPGVHDRKVRIKREAGALDELGRRCPRNGNRPRSLGIAVRSTATVFRHGKVSVMRVESPETGLTDSTGVAEGSTVKRCCPSSSRLFLPSSKVCDLLRISYR